MRAFPLNYGCSGGNCGLCKARLVSGQVRKTRHHDYVLTEAEKEPRGMCSCVPMQRSPMWKLRQTWPVEYMIFRFSRLPPGSRSITALKPGYGVAAPANTAHQPAALSGRPVCHAPVGRSRQWRVAHLQAAHAMTATCCSMCPAGPVMCFSTISSAASQAMTSLI